MAASHDGQQGEYREQVATILSVTQDRIKKGVNRGQLFERYEVEGFEDKTFYNFHDHLIGPLNRPTRAKISYFDDPARPKVEKIVLLEEEPAQPAYPDRFTPNEILMARMSNVKSSIQALPYLEGTLAQRFRLYKQLLRENEEYLFKGELPGGLSEDDMEL